MEIVERINVAKDMHAGARPMLADTLNDAAKEIERLRERLRIAEACSSLATVGVDAHAAVVEVSRETMKKLVAAEARIRELEIRKD